MTTDENWDKLVKKIRISTVNDRLIKIKENLISNEYPNRKIDILIAMDPWLQDNKQDEMWASSSKLGSSAFQMFTKNRKD